MLVKVVPGNQQRITKILIHRGRAYDEWIYQISWTKWDYRKMNGNYKTSQMAGDDTKSDCIVALAYIYIYI